MTRDFLTAPGLSPQDHRKSRLARLARLFSGKSDSPLPAREHAFSRDTSAIESLETRLLMATNYYVSTTGSDSSPGSITAPFRTIQKAANLAVAGDVVNIRAGTYRETVTPAHSGTGSAPIVFRPYGNETVTVSGADRVTGFTQYNGSIYKTSMPWTVGDGKDQVFVNGVMMNEARWPNQSTDSVSRVTTSDFDSATSSTNSSGVATATIRDASLTQAAGYWVGATIHSAMGASGVIVSGTVTASSVGGLTFTFIPNDSAYLPEAGDKYFLSGKLVLLDAGGEWYRDSSGTLYARTLDGGDPDNVTLEVKRRSTTFDLQNRSNVTLYGIKTFAGTILTNDNSSGVTLDHLTAQYVSHYTKTDPKKWGGQLTGETDSGIYLRGTNNVLKNSEIAYSAGNGVHLIGTNLTVTNNIIHDVDYAGTDSSAINTLYNNTTNVGHTITYNTVYNTGRNGIMISGMKGSTVSHNEIYSFGLQTADSGGIYCYDSDGGGTVISYNSVHDGFNNVGGYLTTGIYLDERSRNYVAHHNLAYNVAFGMIVNGSSTNQKIYNNTVIGTSRGLSAMSNATFANCAFTNNIFVGEISGFPQATFTTNLLNNSAVRFVSASSNNYQLASGSAGINTGSLISGITMSLQGNPDIGAFEAGESAWTAGADRRLVPVTPVNLAANVVSSSRIDLSWTESSTSQNAFYIERSSDGIVFNQIAKISGTARSYSDTGLTSSTQYSYRVRADDSGYTAIASGRTNWGVGSVIQAETYSAINGIVNYGNGLGSLDTDDYIRLDRFDFRTGSNQFSASIGLPNGTTGRKIEIRTGSTTGTLLGTLNLQPTGGYQTFKTQSTSITPITGVTTLYLVFKGGSGAGNMDWYSFNQINTTPTPPPDTDPTPTIVQAETYSAASSGVVNFGSGIGGLETGDWVRLDNFNLQGSTTFSANIALGSGLTGRKIEVRTGSINGTLLGTLNLQATANWDTHATQSTPITPVTGATTVYLVFGGGVGVGNIDWYSFSKTTTTTPPAATTTVQAENFSDSSGIVNYGNGVGGLDDGDWLKLDNFNLAGATTFNASIALGGTGTGRKIEIRTGSPSGTLLGTLNVQNTGSWDTHTTQSTTITPVTGSVAVYLVFVGGAGVGNLDWYSFA